MLEAYCHLYHHGPCTAGEVAKALERNRNNMARSLSLLRDKKSARECGTKICSVTGRDVILWDVTDSLPVEVEKKAPTTTEMLAALREQIEELEEENMYLYKRVEGLEARLGE